MKKLLWPYRNCRKLRRLDMRICPLSLSSFLFTDKKGTKDFRDNNNSNSLHRTSKVSNFLVQFLKQEAEKFALTLAKSENIGSDIHKEMLSEGREGREVYQLLDPRIGNQIDGIADNYNKFSLLLSFNPIMIDPRLYIYFYESTSIMIDFDMKKLLLRRLVYHRNFEECWRVLFNTATAFNDLDEFVDVLIDELKIRDNFTYGIYQLLYSGYENIVDKNLVRALIDTFCYRLGLTKENVFSVFTVIEGIRDDTMGDYFSGLENFTSEQMLFFQLFRYRMQLQEFSTASMNNVTNRESLNHILNHIFLDKEVLSKSGWLSFLLSEAKVSLSFGDNPKMNTDGVVQTTESCLLLCLLTHHIESEFNINEYEYLILLRYVNSENIEDLCQICEKRFLLNFHIVNYLMSTCLVYLESLDFLRDFSVRHFNVLSSQLLSSVLRKLFFDSRSNFKLLCNKFKKNSSSTTSKETVENFFHQPYAEAVSPPPLEDLKQMISSFNKLDLAFAAVKGAMNIILRYDYRDCDLVQFYSYIVSDIRLTSHNFVEVTRQILLRHVIIESNIIAKLFEKILSKCWNTDTIMKSNRKIKGVHDNFKKIYCLATENEKARFHNRIRSFGQLLSLLDIDRCAKVLNILHRHLWSDQFDFANSLQGKEYIMKWLITENLRFINKEKKHSATEAILKMKNLVERLEFSSPAARCSLYKYIVRDLPSKAISILYSYKERKSYLTNDIMRSIMSGLLSSHRLKDHEKIQYFREFRNKLKELGYKSTIQKSTAIELLNLVTKMVEKNPGRSSDTVKWILNFSRQKKIPKDVTQKLRRRLLTKHSYRYFQAR